MPGSWVITPAPFGSIHTFTAPEHGWCVTSHVIELPSQLIVVDPQYTLPLAGEVVDYANDLKKPISRLYITHYHPDHLLGAAAFDAPNRRPPNALSVFRLSRLAKRGGLHDD